MQQTSIDTFFKTRKRLKSCKRPASEIVSDKTVTRKLFAQDDGPSSPIKSPIRRVLIKEVEPDEDTFQKEATPEPTSTFVEESVEEAAQNEETGKSPAPEPKEESAVTTPTRSSAEQEQLQKELNLGEFKKLVRQSKRYSTLKTALDKVNATTSRIKTIEQSINHLTSSPDLKRFNNVEFEINSSPLKGNLKPRRLFGHEVTSSPTKNQPYVSPRKLLDEGPATSPIKPAYDRYKHLVADGKDSLVLPSKYVTLRDIFNGVETVVRILMDRKEMITFRRIRNDVQKMIRRNFTEEHLGMIKTVYPEAYELKYEKVRLTFSRDESLELVISKCASHCIDITERKKMFDKLLLERTKLHHQEFLKTLDPPLIVPVNRMMRWHPLFDLNNVPDIEPTPIQRPVTVKDSSGSAKDLLEKTRQLISCNKRMERAVEQLVKTKTTQENDQKNELTNETVVVRSPVVNPIPALQKALKGVPKSLLEKIRAKKAAKMVEAITQTPEKVKEEVMLSRLPELAKIMRIVFVNEKKGILPEDLVLTKVGHSFKEKMPKNELVEHLKLISKHVPGWFNFCTVRNVSYIRLSKDADMSRVLGRLQKLAQPL